MVVTEQSVSASMNQLVAAINKLTELVKTAAEEMHEAPNHAVEEKLDMLINQNGEIVRQNGEISSSLLLLLELNRQHLPNLSAIKHLDDDAPKPLRSAPGWPDLESPPPMPPR